MGGGGGSDPRRANKFLYAPAPPPPSVWALKPPSCALVHKTTYAPMIYTAVCIMFSMRAYPLLGQVGGDWALEISSILGPKWHSPIGSMPFHRAQKLSNSRAQPPPTGPRNGYLCTALHASKTSFMSVPNKTWILIFWLRMTQSCQYA
jgi:hypothetical protein